MAALLRAHTAEGCARLAAFASAKEYAARRMAKLPLAAGKAKLAFLEAANAGTAAGFLHFGGQVRLSCRRVVHFPASEDGQGQRQFPRTTARNA